MIPNAELDAASKYIAAVNAPPQRAEDALCHNKCMHTQQSPGRLAKGIIRKVRHGV